MPNNTFDASLYPRIYKPEGINRFFSSLSIFTGGGLLINILLHMPQMISDAINKGRPSVLALAIPVFVLLLLVIAALITHLVKYTFGYRVILGPDSIRIKTLFNEKTLLRKDIDTYYFRRPGRGNPFLLFNLKTGRQPDPWDLMRESSDSITVPLTFEPDQAFHDWL